MKSKTLAIPIRVVEFSESSQIVSLYTREYGLVDGIAKGAHRERNSFQGPFDMAVLYEVVFLERRMGGLSILTESTVVDGFRALRCSLERQLAAYHLLEFLRVVATAAVPDQALFDLTLESLDDLSLSTGERVTAAAVRFDARALRIVGLLGPLDSCVLCGKVWPGGGRAAFVSASAGGLLCSRCHRSRSYPVVSLPGGAIRLLGLLAGEECSSEEIEASWPTFGSTLSDVVSNLRNCLLEREFRPLNMKGDW